MTYHLSRKAGIDAEPLDGFDQAGIDNHAVLRNPASSSTFPSLRERDRLRVIGDVSIFAADPNETAGTQRVLEQRRLVAGEQVARSRHRHVAWREDAGRLAVEWQRGGE
jgi:hypothetical protein